MTAPESIRQLVEHFKQNQQSYRSGNFNEAQLRLEFLNPFFEALGWDVSNRSGYGEAYKDAVVETSLEVEGQIKAPDYAFRIGGTRKFFVEAKKPSVNIQYEIYPAFQLRRYAWSAKLPLGILTDFEEFAVYDCRSKPNPTDKAATSRVMFLKFTDYIEKWDEIAAIFSKDAVMKGSFDQYAQGVTGKHGTQEVDDAFLKEIEGWRDLLARNLAARNKALSVPELNYAVQMTIDRIIFLRICEDRGIEPHEQLHDLLEREDIYGGLCELFRKADTRYNSGLFHFEKEKTQSSSPDGLSLGLKIDDKTLKEIIKSLYFPCPYVFSVIPADILGQVYERFLGKVIRLTAGHQAKVEEKPEVRKAGGVYYTPTYIVEYIVKNTVGKLLEGKTPKDAAELKIVDPACGSGSFLLGAYQCLLDWHAEWYINNDPQQWAKAASPRVYQAQGSALRQAQGMEWKLTTAEKKRILLDNIHGVDIDPQAVEVTKLSLSLKVLEGESQESIGTQLGLFKERALPDLGRNIQCGNSLIGPDYYTDRQLDLGMDGAEERSRVNAFDWPSAFPQVFARGGFDAVIGNPPYIRIQTLKEWAPTEVKFYKKKYKSAGKGNYDIYVVFVEKGLDLLNENGNLGFVLPNKFFNAQYGLPLRGLISKGKYLSRIVHFSDQQIFNEATTYTCLLFLKKNENKTFVFEKVTNLSSWQKCGIGIVGEIDSSIATDSNWNFTVGADTLLINKMNQMPVKLENIAKRIFQGIKTGADPVFIIDNLGKGKYFSNALKTEIEIESDYLKPLFKSGNMKRYKLHNNSRSVIFPYRNGKLISWDELVTKTPKTADYLKNCKEILAHREKGKWAGKNWYCFSRNQALEIISSPKILTADINPYANYCFDESGQSCFPGGAAGGYGIVLDRNMYLYVLGLLNSKAIDYFHQRISSNFRGGWYGYDAKVIRNIPIRSINFSDSEDVNHYKYVIGLVERMIELNKQTPRTPKEEILSKRDIEITDKKIDALVYELYGLTEDEIKIIEGE
jgi:hypothetical protein